MSEVHLGIQFQLQYQNTSSIYDVQFVSTINSLSIEYTVSVPRHKHHKRNFLIVIHEFPFLLCTATSKAAMPKNSFVLHSFASIICLPAATKKSVSRDSKPRVLNIIPVHFSHAFPPPSHSFAFILRNTNHACFALHEFMVCFLLSSHFLKYPSSYPQSTKLINIRKSNSDIP